MEPYGSQDPYGFNWIPKEARIRDKGGLEGQIRPKMAKEPLPEIPYIPYEPNWKHRELLLMAFLREDQGTLKQSGAVPPSSLDLPESSPGLTLKGLLGPL